ncbi:MAG: cyclic nucleotide-binding domain-containing protein [Desulfobacterales bacterium]|nr:cyclic nucleotide-binding domain-containing protein [Desulfobacterales bacterium]
MIDTAFLKSNDEIINQLMRIPALKSMDGEDLKDLIAASQTKEFDAGDIIFEEGSMGKLIFYLISGKVKVIKDGHVLMTLQRTGDVFGEMGPIGGKARSASVEAISAVNCVEINLSVIDSKNRSDAHMFRYLIFRGFAEILAGRLQYTTEQLIDLRTELDQLKKSP